MTQITKIFHFEMAHAIYGYMGTCKDIHGHSYELHVSVTNGENDDEYINSPGLLLDFKELKSIVNANVIEKFDHRLVLSGKYRNSNKGIATEENLFILEAEPTAENLLIFIRRNIENELPEGILLASLKLFETKDSYAEWNNNNIQHYLHKGLKKQ